MRALIAFPLFWVTYFLLLITSFISRTMAVMSVTFAAVCVNLALWCDSSWLLNKLNMKLDMKEEK